MSFFTLALTALVAVAPLATAAPLADFHGHAARAIAVNALMARDCSSVPDVDPNMRDIVYKETVSKGANYNLLLTVMETILTESNCNNLNCGDRQSHGLFQQQAPGFGWGTVAQTMDPIHATDAFLACAIPAQQSQPGLSPDELAQFCQQAQAGNQYAQNHDRAVQLINDASASTGVPIPGSSGSSKPKPTTAAPPKSSAPASAPPSAPSSSAGGSANVESAPGTHGCAQTYTPVGGDTCNSVANQFNIGLDAFMGMNPSIDGACSNLIMGVAYCVAGGSAAPASSDSSSKVTAASAPSPTADSSSSTDAATDAPAPSAANVESAPTTTAASAPAAAQGTPVSPNTDGLDASCTMSYVPVPGDDCNGVSSMFSMSLDAFYELNPCIDDTCQNLLAGVAYCVASSTGAASS